MQKKIKRLYLKLQNKMMKRWDRALPFAELVVDRWEKAELLGFGKGTSIYDSSIILGNVEVGDNTWIGPNTMLDGTGGKLTIGNHCSISTGVHIYTHDTVDYCVSGGIVPKSCDSVYIGNNCYIGPKVIISKGVTLGDCCIVGANSFVNKGFDDYSIIAGTPAKKIGYVQINQNGEVKRIYNTAKEVKGNNIIKD